MSLLSSPVAHGPSPRTNKAESQVITANTISSLISPSLARSLWLANHIQTLLDRTTVLFLNAYLLSALLLRYSLYFSQILVTMTRFLLIATRLTTKFAIIPPLMATIALLRKGWKKTEATRKKIYFEIALCLLNPYAVALFIFWPGWIPIGLAWSFWQYLS